MKGTEGFSPAENVKKSGENTGIPGVDEGRLPDAVATCGVIAASGPLTVTLSAKAVAPCIVSARRPCVF